MAAHDEAQRRAIPLTTRILRRVAMHIGCDPEDLQGSELQIDLELIVLQECSELLDPRTGDRLTPVDLTRETDHVDMPPTLPAESYEPVTVNQRIPDWIRRQKR